MLNLLYRKQVIKHSIILLTQSYESIVYLVELNLLKHAFCSQISFCAFAPDYIFSGIELE